MLFQSVDYYIHLDIVVKTQELRCHSPIFVHLVFCSKSSNLYVLRHSWIFCSPWCKIYLTQKNLFMFLLVRKWGLENCKWWS